MNAKFLRLMETHRGKILAGWKAGLSANLNFDGKDALPRPEKIVGSTFSTFLFLFDCKEAVDIHSLAPSCALNLLKGLHLPLIYPLEILLTGEEFLEDFLLEEPACESDFSMEERALLIQKIHHVFHLLIRLELDFFCENCAQPLKKALRQICRSSTPVHGGSL